MGPKAIHPTEATSADYIKLLNSSGYESFPFDISFLSDVQYYISFKIQEYKGGNQVHDNILGYYGTFNNMRLVSEFSEEVKKNIKPEEMADAERGIYSMGKKLTVGFIPTVNDSIRPIMLEVENIGGANPSLRMLPQFRENDTISGNKFYTYHTRPFKISEFALDKFIPLVLYGSVWYDPDFRIHRFCGDNEIDPDMSSSILKEIPHYYVIGIEVKPIRMVP